MARQFTLLFCLLAQVSYAQFFIETGATGQFLRIQRSESPALSAMSQLILRSGGNPDVTLPKIIKSQTIAPRINIGYRLPFDDFTMMIAAGTSQDFGNSFRLKGSAAVNGKTYPYPECFSVRLRGYKTWKGGWTFGGELAYDNQRSETILNNSNMEADVKGLISQISDDINLLGSGATQTMQINILGGWEKTKDQFEFSIFGLFGMVGKGLGIQADFKVRYYFGER
jgi:hypothetical protein